MLPLIDVRNSGGRGCLATHGTQAFFTSGWSYHWAHVIHITIIIWGRSDCVLVTVRQFRWGAVVGIFSGSLGDIRGCGPCCYIPQLLPESKTPTPTFNYSPPYASPKHSEAKYEPHAYRWTGFGGWVCFGERISRRYGPTCKARGDPHPLPYSGVRVPL